MRRISTTLKRIIAADASTLDDFLVKRQMQGVKEIEDRILEALCYVLNLFAITYTVNSKEVQYAKTRLLAYIKKYHEDKYVSLKKKLENGFCVSFLAINRKMLSLNPQLQITSTRIYKPFMAMM